MLVYGDRVAIAAPRQRLSEITAALRAVENADPGPLRHDLLTRAVLHAAGLLQGLADAEFAARGFDDLSPVQDAGMALMLMLARKLTTSAWSGYSAIGPGVAPELMELAIQRLPASVEIRTPEGFAFYALYPEAYLKAAAEHPWPATPLVIGLRSIGAALAPLVAVATGARTVLTLRPTGPPFRRDLKVSGQIRALLAGHAGPFAIVDEGPGLSGSSFGAAADLLQELAVAEERIVFLPSHAGDPGPQAEPRHRERWSRAARRVATFDDLVAETPLADWFADLTGPVARIDDLSAGAWRETRKLSDFPPAHAAQERLKFRLHTASGRWLAKFAGLGEPGEAKFERARRLHRAGFTPEPLALRRGFLLERWEDAVPLDGIARDRLIDQLAAYLAFRAAALPAGSDDGAARPKLAEMARLNVAEALGEAASAALAARLEALADAPASAPVHVDGRLHAWEWLRTPEDLLLKTDALDHSAAHDLVGCQEIAWDIAGAAAEFELSPEEIARLCDAVEASTGDRPDVRALAFHAICYPAFQAGYWTMAQGTAAPEERPRLAAQAARYARRLNQLADTAESAD